MLMLFFVLCCGAGLIGSETEVEKKSGGENLEVMVVASKHKSIQGVWGKLLDQVGIFGDARVEVCKEFDQNVFQKVREMRGKEKWRKRRKIMRYFLEAWLLRRQRSQVREIEPSVKRKKPEQAIVPSLMPQVFEENKQASSDWRWVPYYDDVCKGFCKNALSSYPRLYVAYKNEQSMVSVVKIESSKDSFWRKWQNDLFQQLGIHRDNVIQAVQEHFGGLAQDKIWYKNITGLFDSPEWIARGLLTVPASVMNLQDPRYQKAKQESAILMHESVTYEDFMSCAIALRQQALEKQARGEELNYEESEVLREQATERMQHLQELLKKPLASDEEIVFYREADQHLVDPIVDPIFEPRFVLVDSCGSNGDRVSLW